MPQARLYDMVRSEEEEEEALCHLVELLGTIMRTYFTSRKTGWQVLLFNYLDGAMLMKIYRSSK